MSNPPLRRRLLMGASVAAVAAAAVTNRTSPALASTATATPDWINVTDPSYGADPTGQNDSTAAINNALAAVPASGGVVYFPAGQYMITGPLLVNSFTTLQGDADGYHQANPTINTGSVILQTSTSADGITAAPDQSSIVVRNLAIIGPGAGTGCGVNLTLNNHTNMEFLDFEDVYVGSFGSHGFSLQTPIVSRFTRCAAETCGGNGFNVYGLFRNQIGPNGNSAPAQQPSTSCTFTSCYANICTGAGYSLTNVQYSSLHSCAAGACAAGFQLQQCLATTLISCGSESSADAFELTGTVPAGANATPGASCNLVGCYSYASTSRSVLISQNLTNSLICGLVEIGSPQYSIDYSDPSCSGISLACNSTIADMNGGASAAVTYQQTPAGNLTISGGLSIGGVLSTGAAGTIKFGAAADTDLYRLAAGTLATDGALTIFGSSGLSCAGPLDVTAPGSGLKIKEGSNCKQGIASLAAGKATITNAAVTANSRIQLTIQTPGGTVGSPYVSARSPGASFTIRSTSSTDTSTVAYLITEPG